MPYTTYLVGGAVRDRLLGYPHDEHDWVVVGATPEQLLEAGFTPVGQDFPVFLHPKTGEEYALARTERKSGVGYGGFTFHTSPDVTLEQDLQRRDLTINAMAMPICRRAYCATSPRPLSKTRCGYCALPALLPATITWVFRSRQKRRT